jgi:hypothetical protein
MKKIKLFEDFTGDYKIHIFDFYEITRDTDIRPDFNKDVDLDFIKKYTDKFIGPGFYEKVYKRSEYIYSVLLDLSTKYELLSGFADSRFESITKPNEKEVNILPCLCYRDDVISDFNSYRFYLKKLNLESVICNIISTFLWDTIHGSHNKKIRTSDESIYVDDEKWSVLNIPDNKSLYNNLSYSVIKYIENFDLNEQFIPCLVFSISNNPDRFYSVDTISRDKCDELFQKFLPLLKKIVKKDFETITPLSHKYHSLLNEYQIILRF